MTAKTTRDEAGEVEAVPAEEETAEAEEETAAQPEKAEKPEKAEEPEKAEARPAPKRKRRVRVIEVIDDEDLDEVLEALDAEDEAAEEEPAPKPKPKPKPQPKPKAAEPAEKAKPRPSVEPPEEEAEEKPAAQPAGKAAPAEPAAAKPTVLGLGVPQAVAVVVVVALLASLAIWQWRSASSKGSEADDRAAVAKVASDYGDVAFSYNAQNYQSQADKAQKLLAGDLLEQYKKSTLPSLSGAFRADAQVVLSSKTNSVYVGSVDGRFATAVVMADVSIKTKSGQADQPATLLRLSLSKIDGKWKVTQQYPSGVNDQNRDQQGQLPAGVPSDGASKTPKSDKSEKPEN